MDARTQYDGNLERNMAVSYGLIGAILIFGLIGYLIDRWMATSPWGLLIGLLVGVGLGLLTLRQLLRNRRSR